ncbi:MAG TPA: proline dehydrogenase family protein [Candidatus Acidoferrales bacterium]|nr:proline dehydrogenase family protein [Candidatus Acidoferrales bacterium]
MSWIRRMMVSASENTWLRERAPRYRFVQSAAARFLPGEDVEAALAAARRLAADGIATLLTYLGENVRDRSESEAVTEQYLALLDSIQARALPAEISVKLTQLGLDVDGELCYANLAKLVEHAGAQTVWIDMEQSAYVDRTLALHERAQKVHRQTGLCLQAYLYRTEKDLALLVSRGASVRLVKGAYSESREIAYATKAEVDERYFRLTQVLLGSEGRRTGVRAVLATHDRKLIARIAEWADREGISKKTLEFAMLYGIQRAEQLRLAQQGYRSDVLISYGTSWFPWYMRRLAERPANVFFVVRNLFSS